MNKSSNVIHGVAATLLTSSALAATMLFSAGPGCSKAEHPDEWLVSEHDVMSPKATVIAQGTGSPLAITAPKDGYVYLRDATSGHLVSTVRVVKGDDVEFSPANATLAIEHKDPVKLSKIDLNHKYEILFAHPDHF